MRKKSNIRSIDKVVCLSPGLYELGEPFNNPHIPHGFWMPGTKFVIEKHTDKIGKSVYEYFSLRLAGNNKYLIKSYQTDRWNALVIRLELVTDDIEKFISKGKISPLYILDQLEQSGRITRADIKNAIKQITKRLGKG